MVCTYSILQYYEGDRRTNLELKCKESGTEEDEKARKPDGRARKEERNRKERVKRKGSGTEVERKSKQRRKKEERMEGNGGKGLQDGASDICWFSFTQFTSMNTSSLYLP